ncbi:MAG: N-acetylmuramoyl-L-alanine amidase [Pseudomonadota bacterium]|nr:N-acetylmuramoyl-L-alanine amidase [Pseudomonadota bacterium]
MTGSPTARPSPNFNARATGTDISMLILHYTNMTDAEAALARLVDPASQVSAHYLIARDGEVFALVDEADRAWHAGVSAWQGIRDINSASVGIELDHPGHDVGGQMIAYPPAQMAALVDLSKAIITRHNITPDKVLGHSDVAPGRKIDPGEALDWAALAREGVGLWPEAVEPEEVATLKLGDATPAVAALQQALRAYGYDIAHDGVFGPQMSAVISAFQRHFRPSCVDGQADGETQTLVYTVCRAQAALDQGSVSP